MKSCINLFTFRSFFKS